MAFAEGQQVRVKGGHRGTIARKLAFFDDMYVVLLDGNQTPPRRLAHEADLEPVICAEERLSA